MKSPRTGREHDLVVRAREGDGDALRALLEGHEAALRRRLDRGVPPPLRRRVSVADVLQETWIVAFPRIAEFEDRGDAPGATVPRTVAYDPGRSIDRWLTAIATKKLYGRAASKLAKGMATGKDT